MSRLADLRDREIGKRCVLVANGPSLNRMDLSFLKNETVIGLNKIYLGLRQFGFYPKYYVAVNDLVVQQSSQHIQALNCIKFISRRNASSVPENALTHHINTDAHRQSFYQDISQGVREGWTVTFAALQVAYHLGFSEVVLIGLDHRYTYAGQPNETKVMQGDDPNHFSPHYFANGQQWDNPDLAHSEESYQIAKQVYAQAGRRIMDATLDGACTVFDKVNYQEIFNMGVAA